MYTTLFHVVFKSNITLVVVNINNILASIEEENRIENERKISLENRTWRYFLDERNQNEELLAYYPMYGDVNDCVLALNFMLSDFSIENRSGIWSLKNTQSKFYNVANNCRVTTDNPQTYGREIHVYGHCNAVGCFVEDKMTIASILQRHINTDFKEGFRVTNRANWGGFIRSARKILSEIASFKARDIIVILTHDFDVKQANLALKNFSQHNFFNFVDYSDSFNVKHSHDILFDNIHMGSRGYEIIAGRLYGLLRQYLSDTTSTNNALEEFCAPHAQHFEEIKNNSGFSGSIGSIVMNCNPFTFGHLYLIKKALTICDYIYIFIVEEDKSYFSTEHRLQMVNLGTADLKRCIVLKSTSLILSAQTFPEYFLKDKLTNYSVDMSNDLNIFCDFIAKVLNIKYRFVGKEPYCNITRQYNDAMRRILPQNGINFIEIDRLEVGEKAISASAVRRFISENSIEDLSKYVPRTTLKFLVDNGYIRKDSNSSFEYIMTKVDDNDNHHEDLATRLDVDNITSKGFLDNVEHIIFKAMENFFDKQKEIDLLKIANAEYSSSLELTSQMLGDLSRRLIGESKQFSINCEHIQLKERVLLDNIRFYLSRSSLGQPFRFDENFYLNKHEDVKNAVCVGLIPSGFAHWMLYGFDEQREVRFFW